MQILKNDDRLENEEETKKIYGAGMIAIRVDGNGDIGIGHIMRCMSIAGALVENGVEVLFITCDNLAEEII